MPILTVDIAHDAPTSNASRDPEQIVTAQLYGEPYPLQSVELVAGLGTLTLAVGDYWVHRFGESKLVHLGTDARLDELASLDPDTLDPTVEPSAAWDARADDLEERVTDLEEAGPGGGGGGTWGTITGILGDQTDLAAALAGKQPAGSYAATGHGHAISDVVGLAVALSGFAPTVHGHVVADVTGLQAALDAKQAAGSYAAASHTHAQSDITGLTTALGLLAPLASPALTGTPTAPTAAAGTSTTRIATTAFVQTALAGIGQVINLIPGSSGGNPLGIDVWANTGWGLLSLTSTSPYTYLGLTEWVDLNLTNTSLPVRGVTMYKDLGGGNYAGTHEQRVFGVDDAGLALEAVRKRDYVGGSWGSWGAWANVPTLTLKAPIDSPALTGNPTVPTQSPGDNSTKAASTAFVTAAVAAGGGGGSFVYATPKSSGQYVIPPGVESGTRGPEVSGTGALSPVPIYKTDSYDALILKATTLEVGVNIKVLLYSSDANGHPLTLVAEATASIATTGNKVMVFAAPVTLTPGIYWVGARTDIGTVAKWGGFGASASIWGNAVTTDINLWTQAHVAISANLGTYAAPTATLSGWTYTGNYGPIFKLRKA